MVYRYIFLNRICILITNAVVSIVEDKLSSLSKHQNML